MADTRSHRTHAEAPELQARSPSPPRSLFALKHTVWRKGKHIPVQDWRSRCGPGRSPLSLRPDLQPRSLLPIPKASLRPELRASR